MSLVAKREKRKLCPEGVFDAHAVKVEAVDHQEYGERHHPVSGLKWLKQ